jgi:hypothetical protein
MVRFSSEVVLTVEISADFAPYYDKGPKYQSEVRQIRRTPIAILKGNRHRLPYDL